MNPLNIHTVTCHTYRLLYNSPRVTHVKNVSRFKVTCHNNRKDKKCHKENTPE